MTLVSLLILLLLAEWPRPCPGAGGDRGAEARILLTGGGMAACESLLAIAEGIREGARQPVLYVGSETRQA
jgi:hypothetical protein